MAAKQNQKILLAEHFSKVNITDPSGLIVSDIASPVTFTSSEEVDPDDLARRTAFLKLQRDKLLAMRRVEREKQLILAEKKVRERQNQKVQEQQEQLWENLICHQIH